MFKNILLTVDLDHQDQHVVAIKAATEYSSKGANIYVVTVLPMLEGGGIVSSFLPENYENNIIEKAQVELHSFTDKYMPEMKDIKHLVVHGRVYEKITDISKQLDIDLIIAMASSPKDKKSLGFGPNVARIARYSECSVLILR